MPEPEEVLPPAELISHLQFLPGSTLIGSYARDYWTQCVADLPPTARTQDIDFTLAVDSTEHYASLVSQLGRTHGTGLRVTVMGQGIDVIPFGGLARDGLIEPSEGHVLDVTGLEESAASAATVPVGDVFVRIPALPCLIGLKIIAWGHRIPNDKDARDLGPLLDATTVAPFVTPLWDSPEMSDRWDYIPELMGPYAAGRFVADTWYPHSLTRLASVLADTARLGSMIAMDGPSHISAEDRRQQLAAFLTGCGRN